MSKPKTITCYNLKKFFKEFTKYRVSKGGVATKENAGDYCRLLWGSTEHKNNEPLLKSFFLGLKSSQQADEKHVYLDFSQVNYPIRTVERIENYQKKLATKLEEIWEKGSLDTSSLDWNWFLESDELVESNLNNKQIGWWVAGGILVLIFGLLYLSISFNQSIKKKKQSTKNQHRN